MRKWLVCMCAVGLLTACGENEEPEPTGDGDVRSAEVNDGPSSTFEAAATSDLSGTATSAETFTYFPGYIEIDRLDDGTSLDFGDANLFGYTGTAAELAACATPNGADPADGTCDARLPASGYAPCTSPLQAAACACTGDATLDTDTCINVTHVDWNEVLTGGGMLADPARLDAHRLLDDVKTDGSSFKNGSCVTETKVLGKMDLTAGAVANNSEYSYLALKRHGNNGDAGYNWIFTEIPPALDSTFGNCSAGAPLVYTLTEGDVMIVGNFNPSSGADLLVRRVTPAADGLKLLAQDVVSTTATTTAGDPIWEEIPGSENLAAVNTTDTGAGVLEVIDGVDQAGNRTDKGAVSGTPGAYNYGPNIFAEAAVDFTVFTNGGNLCEAKFYGSVITQPSSSKTSDLKDLLGPQLFNFGSLTVEASVAPTCGRALEYSVDSVIGPGVETTDPDSVNGLVCNWTFTHTDGSELTTNDCTGTLNLGDDDPTGTWTGQLELAIGSGVSCSTTSTVGTVDVFDALDVAVDTAPGCGLDFTYSGTVTGGSGSLTQEWDFNPDVVSAADGSATVASDGTYAATLYVTDDREDITCTADASSSVTVAKALSITPKLTPTCDREFGYEVAIDGGLGSPTVEWTFSGAGAATPSTSSATSGDVTVDADGSYSATVTVSEERGDETCSTSETLSVDAFAALSASLELSESCSLEFGYTGSATGGSGSLSYDWTFEPSGHSGTATATAPNGTSGNVSVSGEGSYDAKLVVTDDRTDVDCSTSANGSIDVYAPLSVSNVNLTPTCDLAFGYSGSYSGGSANASVAWTFTGGTVTPTTTTGLSGTATVGGDGNYTGTMTVTDVRNKVTCTASGSDSVDAYAPLAVDVATTDRCDSSFDYAASGLTGGSGSVSYAWTFTPQGSGAISNASTTTGASGNASVTAGNQDYVASLVVTDNRTDITCTAGGSDTATPLDPIAVNITPSDTEATCPLNSDALSYTATVSGGNGSYQYAWTGCSSATASCTVDPSDSTFCADQAVSVKVGDTSGICTAKDSEQETYKKVTIITSTDN